MDRRFQIFVSSTFDDLREEREKIFDAIMSLRHIPAGMEYFNAIDESQLKFIKSVIDESDYYVLIIGARYGSLDKDGISYTEREYNYAVEKGLKVIALLHSDLDAIPRGKTDKNDSCFEKLIAFREKVRGADRNVGWWRTLDELVSRFQSSLIQTISRHKMPGWVRGNSASSVETIRELYELKLENQKLREQVKNFQVASIVENLIVEVASITNPKFFSSEEIECIAVYLKYPQASIPPNFLEPRKEHYNSRDIAEYWIEAINWFVKILKTCRFDIRITNPNLFTVENMDVEQHLFAEDGEELKFLDEINNVPNRPDRKRNVYNTSQQPPAINLKPKQSTLFTHRRYFIPSKDTVAKYQRIIFANNILEPIKKEFIIKYKVLTVETTVGEICKEIDTLEKADKFNDKGAFEYVEKLLQERGLL